MAKPVSKRSSNTFEREARQLRTLKKNWEKSGRLFVRQSIEIGKFLNRMKHKLDHGDFIPWVRKHFGPEDRAQRLMSIASLPIKNRDLRFLEIAPAALYELRHASPQQVSSILARAEAGEHFTARQVRMQVRDVTQTVITPVYVRTAEPELTHLQPVKPEDPPEDPALAQCVDLIETMCAIDSWPAVLDVAAAIRRKQRDVTPSGVRAAASFFQALAAELDAGSPISSRRRSTAIPAGPGPTKH